MSGTLGTRSGLGRTSSISPPGPPSVPRVAPGRVVAPAISLRTPPDGLATESGEGRSELHLVIRDNLAAADDYRTRDLPGALRAKLLHVLHGEVDELVPACERSSKLAVAEMDHDGLTLRPGQEGVRGLGQVRCSGSKRRPNLRTHRDT